MKPERLLAVIHKLFEASVDATKWNGFLAELAKCFRARAAQVVRGQVADKSQAFSVLYGFDEAIQSLYGLSGGLGAATARFEEHLKGLWHVDPSMALMHRYPGGGHFRAGC